MKRAFSISYILLAIIGLLGCGASAPVTTNASPATTTVAPTEAEKTYPEPDKLIALTFDDGPNEHMDKMIDILAETVSTASTT